MLYIEREISVHNSIGNSNIIHVVGHHIELKAWSAEISWF